MRSEYVIRASAYKDVGCKWAGHLASINSGRTPPTTSFSNSSKEKHLTCDVLLQMDISGAGAVKLGSSTLKVKYSR